jgi:hypothetical protein
VAARNEVIRFLSHVSGPAVGVAALLALFRGLARCVLQDLLRRFQRVWRYRYREQGFRLTWHLPGRVWAIDFSEALYPIDGVYGYLFAVRDLASHEQLAWQPVQGQTADEALLVLRQLFQQHGPPLVLKSDNGSAFLAAVFQDTLQCALVLPLLSPPRYPQYNGALERSNGTLKTYTHQHALHEGHAFRWTSEDVERARQLANTLSRPWGSDGPTPEEAWQGRTPITAEERTLFLAAVDRERVAARHDLGLDETAALSPADQARLDRLALPRVLSAQGYLTMTPADRPAKKSKRWSREQLAERAAKHLDNTLARPEYATAPVFLLPLPSDQSSESACINAAATSAAPPLGLDTRFADESSQSPAASACWPWTAGCQVAVACTAPTDPAPPVGAKNTDSALATVLASARMDTSEGVVAVSPGTAAGPTSAHGERTNCSWFRRSVTLLLSLAKAANISR